MNYASISVAEKCIFMALALAKRFPLYLREGSMSYAPELIGDEMWDKPTDIIGFEEVTQRLVAKCEAGALGGVAFESDDPKILQHNYQSNIFVTPHNAHCTHEAL